MAKKKKDEYRCVVYDTDGNVVADATVTVELEQ